MHCILYETVFRSIRPPVHETLISVFNFIFPYRILYLYLAIRVGRIFISKYKSEGPHNFRFAFFHRDRELDSVPGGSAGRPQNINENFYINLFDRGATRRSEPMGPRSCFLFINLMVFSV